MTSLPYFFGQFNLHDGVNFFVLSKGLDPPALQYVQENVARIPGVKYSGERINEKPIPVVMKVVSVGSSASRIDLENKIDVLLAAMQYRQQRLLLHTNDSRYYIANCTSASYVLDNKSPISATVNLTFTCYQPYAYAASQSTYTMASVVLTNVSTGTYQSPVQQMTGGGNVFCYPTVVITNTGSVTVTSVTLSQLTDGMALTVAQSLNTGDTLTIYSDPLASNGLSARYNNGGPLNFAGSFFVQEPNSTNWQITANASSAPTVQSVWTWNARFAS